MEDFKNLLNVVDINETEAVVNTLIQNMDDEEAHGDPPSVNANDAVVHLRCCDCNDGERAILAGYVTLMRQCIELAEKVGSAKA